jgi:hypothetical protein
LRGVFTIFRLIKKTGQDNSYMHLSGANFWHLIFRPNFKVVDIINDIFRNGRNTQILLLQLKEYETVVYFLQLSQNLTWDCLLIFVNSSVFLPVFALCAHNFFCDLQNNFISTSCKNR